MILIDRLLDDYGPEAKGARLQLKHQYAERFARLFQEGRRDRDVGKLAPDAGTADTFRRSLRTLVPATDEQRATLSRVQQLYDEIALTRWLSFEEATGSTPPAFLAVLVSWLVMMFVSFGLFTPGNPTAYGSLFLGSVAVATFSRQVATRCRPSGARSRHSRDYSHDQPLTKGRAGPGLISRPTAARSGRNNASPERLAYLGRVAA